MTTNQSGVVKDPPKTFAIPWKHLSPKPRDLFGYNVEEVLAHLRAIPDYMTEFDLYSDKGVEFVFAEDNTHLSVEDRLDAHRAAGHICADSRFCLPLQSEEGQKTLKYFRRVWGITAFLLPGTVFVGASGRFVIEMYAAEPEKPDGPWFRRHQSNPIGTPSMIIHQLT